MVKRPCLNCNTPGHLARNCPEKKALVKAIAQGDFPKPAFLGCIQVVDDDGFTKLAGRPRPQAANLFDFEARAATIPQSADRFRPLTIAHLDAAAEERQSVQAREASGAALSPTAPIGQREAVAVANSTLKGAADLHTKICSSSTEFCYVTRKC